MALHASANRYQQPSWPQTKRSMVPALSRPTGYYGLDKIPEAAIHRKPYEPALTSERRRTGHRQITEIQLKPVMDPASHSPLPTLVSTSANVPPFVKPDDNDKYGDEWERLAEKIEEYDNKEIKDSNDDIDCLLVFTGLFSAVLTAFNVESYKGLTQDSSNISAAALLQISRQLSSLHSNSTELNTPEQAYTSPEFSPSDATVLINILWFSSLVLSLISASLGMLVKRWLREYLTTGYTSPKERIRLRHYRYSHGLIKWRVFEIAVLPQLLLQLSLILFFIGLSEFLRQLHPIVGWLITSLIIIWLIVLAISTIAPIFSFSCPYKNPLSKSVFKTAKRIIIRLLRREHTWLPRDYNVRRARELDIDAMIQADESAKDDEFLANTLRECIKHAEGSSNGDAVRFIQKMLEHRLDHTIPSLATAFIEFSHVATKALSTSLHIALDRVEHRLRDDRPDLSFAMQEMLVYIFAALDHSYTQKRQIGHAMDRGLRLLPILMSKDESWVQECLRLLSRYRNVPVYLAKFTEKDSSRLIRAAQGLMDQIPNNPLQICRVILSIVNLQQDLYVTRTNRGPFYALLASLRRAIEAPRLSAVSDESSAAQTCIYLGSKLNRRQPNFVPNNLERLFWEFSSTVNTRGTI